MVRTSGECIESLGSIKLGRFLDEVGECYVLKKIGVYVVGRSIDVSWGIEDFNGNKNVTQYCTCISL